MAVLRRRLSIRYPASRSRNARITPIAIPASAPGVSVGGEILPGEPVELFDDNGRVLDVLVGKLVLLATVDEVTELVAPIVLKGIPTPSVTIPAE